MGSAIALFIIVAIICGIASSLGKANKKRKEKKDF
jgi:choline-glycine betaine transporter